MPARIVVVALLAALLTIVAAPSAVSAVQPPALAWFTPDHGPTGSQMRIGGYRFTGATQVKFNGVAAAFTVTSTQTITATVPAGASSGPITVTTPAGSVTSQSSFLITVPPPAFRWFSPTSGSPGETVSIGGSNFVNVTAVKFNGAPAQSFTVASSSTIRAVVPTAATTGPLTVGTATGTSTTVGAFTVAHPTPGVPPAPVGVWFSTAGMPADAVTVNWQPPASAFPQVTGYQIHRDGISSLGFPPWTVSVGAGGRSVRVEHLKPGTLYTITVQATNSAGPGIAATIRFRAPTATSIYAINASHRVVSISAAGTVTALNVGIPAADLVRADHQGYLVVAGGNRIVRYNITTAASTVVATGPNATAFQLDNAGNVYVGGTRYDAITLQPSSLPVGDYVLTAANGDLFKITGYAITRSSLANPSPVQVQHDFNPLPPGPDSNGFLPPQALAADQTGAAYFESISHSFTVDAHYFHRSAPGAGHSVGLPAADVGRKVLGFNAAGNIYLAEQRHVCLSFETCDPVAVVKVSTPNGAAVGTATLDGLTVDSPTAGTVDLTQIVVDGAGSIYAITANSIVKFGPSGGAGATVATGAFSSASIVG